MSQPNNTVVKFFKRLDAAGAPSPLKNTGDFVFVGYHAPAGTLPAAYTHNSVITELANGYYAWSYSLAPTAGFSGLDIDVLAGTDTIEMLPLQGEVENQDLDAIYASASRPTVTLSGGGTIGQVTPVTLVNKRYRKLTFNFVDAAGVNIDMTAGVLYTAYTFAVRARDNQTTAPPKIDAVNGTVTAGFTYVITGGMGYVDVEIPEDATFFTLPEGASVIETIDHRFELTADLVASPAARTVAIVQSSPLNLVRREVGT